MAGATLSGPSSPTRRREPRLRRLFWRVVVLLVIVSLVLTARGYQVGATRMRLLMNPEAVPDFLLAVGPEPGSTIPASEFNVVCAYFVDEAIPNAPDWINQVGNFDFTLTLNGWPSLASTVIERGSHERLGEREVLVCWFEDLGRGDFLARVRYNGDGPALEYAWAFRVVEAE